MAERPELAKMLRRSQLEMEKEKLGKMELASSRQRPCRPMQGIRKGRKRIWIRTSILLADTPPIIHTPLSLRHFSTGHYWLAKYRHRHGAWEKRSKRSLRGSGAGSMEMARMRLRLRSLSRRTIKVCGVGLCERTRALGRGDEVGLGATRVLQLRQRGRSLRQTQARTLVPIQIQIRGQVQVRVQIPHRLRAQRGKERDGRKGAKPDLLPQPLSARYHRPTI